jgi:hypothetical protein
MSALRAEVSAALDLAADSMKRHYDKKRRDPPHLAVGDWVLVDAKNIHQDRPKKKLSDKRVGPFQIVQVLSPHLFKLDLPPSWSHSRVFNVERLVPYRQSRFPMQRQHVPPNFDISPPCVSAVHDHRQTRSSLSFFVSLDDASSPDDAFWEDALKLHDPSGLISAYRTAHGLGG